METCILTQPKTVLITGANGNLGRKLTQHLAGRYSLCLTDLQSTQPEIIAADLSIWDKSWVDQFQNVDAVVHLAADPTAEAPWAQLVAPNIDALINVFTAAAQAGVKRLVYASSNHVMGGYKDNAESQLLTADTPVKPGTHYLWEGQLFDSVAYAGAKLFGERLGKSYADIYGLSTIAVRIGWVRPGENRAADIDPAVAEWFRLMWLSNRDFCQLFERCIEADPAIRFAIVNGVSANTGTRWEIDFARKLVGYAPQDDVTGSVH
jgi:NAD+ dependent glucose-6-phosphate dehydrogenase